jgi:hypothetical protein
MNIFAKTLDEFSENAYEYENASEYAILRKICWNWCTQDNGEWQLLTASAERNVVVYDCCPEPYIDITATIFLRSWPYKLKTTLPPQCSENSIYVFPKKELRGLSPNSYIHVSVSDL